MNWITNLLGKRTKAEIAEDSMLALAILPPDSKEARHCIELLCEELGALGLIQHKTFNDVHIVEIVLRNSFPKCWGEIAEKVSSAVIRFPMETKFGLGAMKIRRFPVAIDNVRLMGDFFTKLVARPTTGQCLRMRLENQEGHCPVSSEPNIMWFAEP